MDLTPVLKIPGSGQQGEFTSTGCSDVASATLPVLGRIQAGGGAETETGGPEAERDVRTGGDVLNHTGSAILHRKANDALVNCMTCLPKSFQWPETVVFNCGPQPAASASTWELVRNANDQAPPQSCRIRTSGKGTQPAVLEEASRGLTA